MSELAKLTVAIDAKIAGLTKALKVASYQVSGFGKNVSRTFNDAASAGAKGFKNVVRSDAFQAAAVAAGGLGFAIKGSVQQAIAFESAMADVKKVVDFPTPQAFKEMQRDILNLSKSIPVTQSGFAEIIAAAGQAGIAREELTQFATSAAQMSTAFDITAAEAGEAMAKMRTSMGLSQVEVESLADAMNHLSNNMASSAPEITNFMLRVGAEANKFAFAETQVAAFGSAMIAAGAPAEVAATSFRNLTKALASGGAATKSQNRAFSELGLNATDVAKRMQQDATGTILDVFKRLGEAPADLRATLATQLFGSEARALAPLLTNADLLKGALDSVADSDAFKGSMLKEFEARAGTTANQMQLFRNNVAGLGIAIGSVLLPPINGLIKFLTPAFGVLADLAGICPPLTAAVVGLGAAFVGLVAVAPFISAFIGVIGAIKTALTGMALGATIAGWAGAIGPALAGIAAVVTGPIGLTVAAIVGVGLALKALWDLCPPFREAMTSVWEGIKATVMRAWEALKGAFEGLMTYFGGLAKIIQGVFTFDGNLIKEGFGQALGGVKQIFTSWIGWLRGFLPKGMNKAFGKAAKPIAQRVERIIERIKAAFGGLVTFFSGIGEMIAGVFTMDGSRIAEGFQTSMDGVGQYVQAWLGGIGDLFGGSVGSWFSGIGDAARSAFEGLSTTLSNVWQAVLDAGLGQMITGVQQIMQGVVDVVQGVWNTIVGIFTGNSEQAVAGVEQAFGGIQGIFDGLGNYFSGLWSLISTSAQATWDGLVTAATTCFNNIVSFISGIPAQIATHWETIKTQGIEAFQALVDWIKNVPQMLLGVGEAIINTIIDGIKSRAEALKATVQEAFNGVREMLPFSDAKTGPFSELTKNGKAIVSTIARGVEMNERVLQDQLGNVARKSMEEVHRETVESDIAQNLGTDLADSLAQTAPSAPIVAEPMPRQEEQGQKKGGLFGGLFDKGFGGLLGGLVDQFVPGLRGFGGAFGNMLDGQFDVSRLLGQAANSFLPGAGGAIASQLIPTVAPMLQKLLPEQGGFTQPEPQAPATQSVLPFGAESMQLMAPLMAGLMPFGNDFQLAAPLLPQGAFAQPQAPGLQGAAVDPSSMGLGGGGTQSMSINSPITINVTEPGASAQEIAGQVQMVFADLVSDAESGVRAMLND